MKVTKMHMLALLCLSVCITIRLHLTNQEWLSKVQLNFILYWGALLKSDNSNGHFT